MAIEVAHGVQATPGAPRGVKPLGRRVEPDRRLLERPNPHDVRLVDVRVKLGRAELRYLGDRYRLRLPGRLRGVSVDTAFHHVFPRHDAGDGRRDQGSLLLRLDQGDGAVSLLDLGPGEIHLLFRRLDLLSRREALLQEGRSRWTFNCALARFASRSRRFASY